MANRRIEGQLLLNRGCDVSSVIVDAEPHVMRRIRALFDNSTNVYEHGQYTHKPIRFRLNMSAAKDLLWLMERYTLSCPDILYTELFNQAKEFDRIQEQVASADNDKVYRPSVNAIPLALPLREHQVKFLNMFRQVKRMLLADKMGLGKTPAAISILQEPEARPAIIVVPTHLCLQWEREVHRFLPGVSTHVIRGFKNYPIPKVDVIVTSYNRLGPWEDTLLSNPDYFRTLILDEVHEVRHTGTAKRHACAALSQSVEFCAGLSGTPIYNQGGEIWSVLDVIKPGCLGDEDGFNTEWASFSGAVREPAILNHYLKVSGLLLRRTPEDLGLTFGVPSKHVYTLDADLHKLQEIQNTAKLLALSVLSGDISTDSESAREFDWKLRHATGVAKARPTAEFVKMMLDQGDKVVLAGWHRDVYDIWMKELQAYSPVMYTGSESPAEKDKAVQMFINGQAQVFIISLRSGSGLDGLQKVCSHVVFGELDWSPHVMDQVVARLDRDGQTKHVQAFYLTIADGADPFMVEVITKKRGQHDGLVEGKDGQAQVVSTDGGGRERIREMAKAYLKSIGEECPEDNLEVGLVGDIAGVLRSVRIPLNTEEEMQSALWQTLPERLAPATVSREVPLSKRSRLDFLVVRGEEKVAIECKINSTKRAEVYRQVRKYVEEGKVTAVVIYAPWHGIASFKVDGTPVVVVDTGAQHL